MLQILFAKSFFNHHFSPYSAASAVLKVKNSIYSNYKKPANHLNVSRFLEKFKGLHHDMKDEKISLTGNPLIIYETKIDNII